MLLRAWRWACCRLVAECLLASDDGELGALARRHLDHCLRCQVARVRHRRLQDALRRRGPVRPSSS